MTRHLMQDFFHNQRYCQTQEVTTIKSAVRLHERRGWTLKATYRTRINGRAHFSAEFASASGRESSTLAFRFLH